MVVMLVWGCANEPVTIEKGQDGAIRRDAAEPEPDVSLSAPDAVGGADGSGGAGGDAGGGAGGSGGSGGSGGAAGSGGTPIDAGAVVLPDSGQATPADVGPAAPADAEAPIDAARVEPVDAGPAPVLDARMPIVSCVRGPDIAQTELRGNAGGGQPYAFDCRADQILVGVRGLAGGALGGIAGLCQGVQSDGADALLVGPVEATASAGRGAVVDAVCPPGHAVVGFGGRSGLLIDAIVPTCAPLQRVGDLLVPGANRVDAAQAAGSDGGGNPFAAVSCGGFAVGIFGGAGDSLDSLGLRCGSLQCAAAP